MSLKVAIWCPHGRDGLPLAARLFLDQFPRELVGWTSDGAEAASDMSAVAACGLAIVLCPAEPPVPPAWRSGFRGRVVILPGTSAAWTDATVTALGPWGDVALLADVLPDECENAVLRAAYDDGRDLIWLPALGGVLPTTDEGSNVGLAYDNETTARNWTEFLETFACASRVIVQEPCDERGTVERQESRQVIICSRDPVFSGAAIRDAYSRGIAPIVLGFAGSCVRRSMLCGPFTRELTEPDRARGIRSTWIGLSALLRIRPSCEFLVEPASQCWLDWAECVADPVHAISSIGGRSARVLIALRANETSPRILERRALVARAGLELGLGAHSPFVRSPAVFHRLSRSMSGQELFAILHHLACSEPEWTSAATRWAIGSGDIDWVTRLWTGVCDEFLTEDTAVAVHALAQAFERSLEKSSRSSELCRVRAVVLAVCGRFDLARTDLRWLSERDAQAAVAAMMSILRAWLPALKLGSLSLIPAGARQWWMDEMDVLGRRYSEKASLVRAFGKIWFSCPDQVAQRLQPDSLAHIDATWLAIVLWIQGYRELAGIVWAPFRDSPLPNRADQKLPVLCAKALLGARDDRVFSEHRQLAKDSPEMFARIWPSQLNCFLSWLISRAAQDAETAGYWSERSFETEPLGRALLQTDYLA